MVEYVPTAPGEYRVVVRSPALDPQGKPVLDDKGQPRQHEGVGRFLVYPETTDEMLRKAADHDTLRDYVRSELRSLLQELDERERRTRDRDESGDPDRDLPG